MILKIPYFTHEMYIHFHFNQVKANKYHKKEYILNYPQEAAKIEP